MLEKRSVKIPEDPVFFTETALGFIATAGASVMEAKYRSDAEDLEELMGIIGRARRAVYADKFTVRHYELIVEFVRNPTQYELLRELDRELS